AHANEHPLALVRCGGHFRHRQRSLAERDADGEGSADVDGRDSGARAHRRDRTVPAATLEPMPVTAEPTPNPNAMKFTVGQPVGGPASYASAADAGDRTAADLRRAEGVVRVFMTADCVTLTKAAEADRAPIPPHPTQSLETRFG